MRRLPQLADYPQDKHKELLVSCLNKKYYDKLELAESVANRRVAQVPGLVLGIYRCKFCGMFHLSSRVQQYGLKAIGEKTVIDVGS